MCHYIEAATSASSPAWTDANYSWSGDNAWYISGATNAAIGSGYKNTLAIIAQNSTADRAGTAARAYQGGGLTDWYLPSIDELVAMYSERTTVGGVRANTFYWSSTNVTVSAPNAYRIEISSGVAAAAGKPNQYYVRPVRSF